MKFYGEPNLMVRDSSNNKVFYFDDKGEFETEDEKLINRMKIRFKYEKPKSRRYSNVGNSTRNI